MRLYSLAAHEVKEETFTIPAAFLNWLLLILYHLDTTTLTTIPYDGNSFWPCYRTLCKPRGLKACCREKYYLPHFIGAATRTAGGTTYQHWAMYHPHEYTSSPNYQQGQNHTMTESAIYCRDYPTPPRTGNPKAFK